MAASRTVSSTTKTEGNARAAVSRSIMRRLAALEEAIEGITDSQGKVLTAQGEMTSAIAGLGIQITKLQEADTVQRDGLRAIAEQSAAALATFKGMVDDQRTAHANAMANLTDVLVTKALDQIRNNMVKAVFRRGLDGLVTVGIAGLLFLITWAYNHMGH